MFHVIPFLEPESNSKIMSISHELTKLSLDNCLDSVFLTVKGIVQDATKSSQAITIPVLNFWKKICLTDKTFTHPIEMKERSLASVATQGTDNSGREFSDLDCIDFSLGKFHSEKDAQYKPGTKTSSSKAVFHDLKLEWSSEELCVG